MSNPNRTPLFADKDDDESEGYAPFSAKPAKKPVTVNNNLINLSLNTEKEQETATSGSRRKKVGSSLRKLLKTNRFSRDKLAEPAESPLPGKPNLAAVGAAAAANLQPSTNEPEVIPDEAAAAETPHNETETVPETVPEAIPLTAQNTANVAPATANTAPPAASVPPVPPRPPRRTRFGGTAGGGGNVPPVPTAVMAANTMPAAPGPAAYNQAPATIDRQNNWGPALITALTERYFRRRADKRIMRKVEKTNDQLKQTQEELLAEKLSRRAEKPTQIATTNRPDAAPVPTPPAQIANTERNTINTIERYTESLSAPQETIIHSENNSETLSKPVKAAEIFAASPLAKEIADREIAQKEIKKQVEQSNSAEQQWNTLQKKEKLPPEVANEAVFERRHEVKDSASTQPRMVAAAYQARQKAGGGMSASATNSSISNTINISNQAQPTAPPITKTPDIYKQSIQAGFALGISVIVLGAIAFIILK